MGNTTLHLVHLVVSERIRDLRTKALSRSPSLVSVPHPISLEHDFSFERLVIEVHEQQAEEALRAKAEAERAVLTAVEKQGAEIERQEAEAAIRQQQEKEEEAAVQSGRASGADDIDQLNANTTTSQSTLSDSTSTSSSRAQPVPPLNTNLLEPSQVEGHANNSVNVPHGVASQPNSPQPYPFSMEMLQPTVRNHTMDPMPFSDISYQGTSQLQSPKVSNISAATSNSDLLLLDDEPAHHLSDGRAASSFSLADFEALNYNSTPFEALALDSINDKEELMLLLGGSVPNPSAVVEEREKESLPSLIDAPENESMLLCSDNFEQHQTSSALVDLTDTPTEDMGTTEPSSLIELCYSEQIPSTPPPVDSDITNEACEDSNSPDPSEDMNTSPIPYIDHILTRNADAYVDPEPEFEDSLGSMASSFDAMAIEPSAAAIRPVTNGTNDIGRFCHVCSGTILPGEIFCGNCGAHAKDERDVGDHSSGPLEKEGQFIIDRAYSQEKPHQLSHHKSASEVAPHGPAPLMSQSLAADDTNRVHKEEDPSLAMYTQMGFSADIIPVAVAMYSNQDEIINHMLELKEIIDACSCPASEAAEALATIKDVPKTIEHIKRIIVLTEMGFEAGVVTDALEKAAGNLDTAIDLLSAS